MPSEIHNVFISHIHEDDDGLKKLKALLENHGHLIRDGSITSDRPKTRRAKITSNLRFSLQESAGPEF